MFSKKKKPVDSGLDIPPAPPPVKVTEDVAPGPAVPPPPQPEQGMPTFPDIPPPPGMPTFEEGLKKGAKAPPIKESIQAELPPPMEEPGIPPPPEGEEGPAPPPAPDDEIIPAAPMEIDSRVKAQAPEEDIPAPELPGEIEAPPAMPSFDAVEDEISQEEKASKRITSGPLFVRADNYVSLLDGVSVARNSAKEAVDMFTEYDDLIASGDQELESWRLNLEDVERKMLYIDKALFGRR